MWAIFHGAYGYYGCFHIVGFNENIWKSFPTHSRWIISPIKTARLQLCSRWFWSRRLIQLDSFCFFWVILTTSFFWPWRFATYGATVGSSTACTKLCIRWRNLHRISWSTHWSAEEMEDGTLIYSDWCYFPRASNFHECESNSHH